MTLTSFFIHLLVLVILLVAFFLIRALIRKCWRPKDSGMRTPHRESPGNCGRIPPKIYRRPDPFIYSQQYLMGQGLAVTWDNPDIHLELDGIPTPSSSLAPDTEYEIVARIWNGSTLAPAVNMPVRFFYLGFGIGGQGVFIGETRVDLPVRGAPGHPAFTRTKWRTPAQPGHYCLQVHLIWGDDANPANNVGQENVDVKPLNSPKAAFIVPVHNATFQHQRYRLETNAYQLPSLVSCERETAGKTPQLSREEIDRQKAKAKARHGRGEFLVPAGWRVVVEPEEFDLKSGETRPVQVNITSPENFQGRQAFNLAAFNGVQVAGGVTLYVESR
jgi:hypothetical protein